MIEVKSANNCGVNVSEKLAEIFVDSFYEYFKYFSKDKKILEKAFEQILMVDRFYVGILDGEIAGMAACTDETHNQCINHDRKTLVKHLGIIKGNVANAVFKKEFQKTSDELTDGTASIDFIATSSKYRGKGVAGAIIKHISSLPQYREFIIQDVADTNHAAIRVYERAGFKEYKKVDKNYAKTVGINAYISFKYNRE